MDIQIDIEQVISTISELVSKIESNQTDIQSVYNGLTATFADSSGDEAEALRSLQSAELKMIEEMNTTLQAFAQSIRFAAEELTGLDSTGAQSMY